MIVIRACVGNFSIYTLENRLSLKYCNRIVQWRRTIIQEDHGRYFTLVIRELTENDKHQKFGLWKETGNSWYRVCRDYTVTTFLDTKDESWQFFSYHFVSPEINATIREIAFLLKIIYFVNWLLYDKPRVRNYFDFI